MQYLFLRQSFIGISIVNKPNNQFEEKTSLVFTLSIMGIDCCHTIVHDWLPHQIKNIFKFSRIFKNFYTKLLKFSKNWPKQKLCYGSNIVALE